MTYAYRCLTSAYRVTNQSTTITVRITAEQRHFLATQSVGFRKISDVVRDLIDQAMGQPLNPIDTPSTLGGPTQEGLPSSSSITLPILSLETSSNRDICCNRLTSADKPDEGKPKRRRSDVTPRVRKRPDYPAAFEAFWCQYRAIELRASGQNKILAMAAWGAATQHVTPEKLQECLSAAVNEQRRVQRQGGFASPFPDAFRWLRDGRFWDFLPSDTQQPLEAPSRAFQGPLPSDPF